MYHNQIINDYIIIKYNNNLKKLTDIHTINQSNCSYVNEVLISDIILWWNWMTFSIQIFQESRKKFKRIRRIEIWMECVCKCVSVWVCGCVKKRTRRRANAFFKKFQHEIYFGGFFASFYPNNLDRNLSIEIDRWIIHVIRWHFFSFY